MFITLKVSIEVITALQAVVAEVGRRDRAVANQIRRAASSAALNVAEGSKRSGAAGMSGRRYSRALCRISQADAKPRSHAPFKIFTASMRLAGTPSPSMSRSPATAQPSSAPSSHARRNAS
jgi:hypothetical protein